MWRHLTEEEKKYWNVENELWRLEIKTVKGSMNFPKIHLTNLTAFFIVNYHGDMKNYSLVRACTPGTINFTEQGFICGAYNNKYLCYNFIIKCQETTSKKIKMDNIELKQKKLV